MAQIEVSDLTFTYLGRSEPTLRGINLKVDRGEFVLVTGLTGCGKSTLVKCLNGVIPHTYSGVLQGKVTIYGMDTQKVPMSHLTQRVGLVSQSPEDQLCCAVVEDEVAFGPENLGLPGKELADRVSRALEQVGLWEKRKSAVHTLSGGQKQRLAIAAMLAMHPDVLVLDEPISQLDPVGREEVLAIVKSLNRNHKMTVILVEHRIHQVAHMADRILVMDGGKIIVDKPMSEAMEVASTFHRLGLRLPESTQLFLRLGLQETPLTAEQAVTILQKKHFHFCKKDAVKRHTKRTPSHRGTPVLKAEQATFAYSKKSPPAIHNINLTVEEGEVLAIMGSNGSGKSTLLMHFAALLKPTGGKIEIFGRESTSLSPYKLGGMVSVLFQNPDLMLFNERVRQETEFGPLKLGKSRKEVKDWSDQALDTMEIRHIENEPPLALSVGQRLRTAVASILSVKPRLILLDEPTSGQDKIHIDKIMHYIRREAEKGLTTVFVTHDVETVAHYADRMVVMNDGQVVAQGSPHELLQKGEVLQKAALRSTDSYRMSELLDAGPALTVDELLESWVGDDAA